MPTHRLWAFERGALWVMDLRASPATRAAASTAIQYSEADAGAITALALAMEVESGEVARRLAGGSRCFLARTVAGEIVGYGWVSHGSERIGELERTLRMKPDEAYVWDCATHAPYRRSGVYTALLTFITGTLRNEVLSRVWIGASLGNYPSLKGFVNAGFQPALTIYYLRLGSVSRSWLLPAPGVAPTLFASARWALTQERGRMDGSVAHG
ncbi:MAG TPA: GNAT family N-acetyltransferase [Ktedonobacterales bacterium]